MNDEPTRLVCAACGTAVELDRGDVELPQVITRVKPVYPAGALAKYREGIVLLDAVVLTDGSVGDVVVVRSMPHPG